MYVYYAMPIMAHMRMYLKRKHASLVSGYMAQYSVYATRCVHTRDVDTITCIRTHIHNTHTLLTHHTALVHVQHTQTQTHFRTLTRRSWIDY